MNNSTLVFRSLTIIIFITGIAHLVNYASGHSNDPIEKVGTDYSIPEKEIEIITSEEQNKYNQNTDYIIGRWKVSYNTTDFKGAIVYEIKKENAVFNAYTFEYQDDKGNVQKAEKSKALTIKSFDGYKGYGVYIITYEGEKYDVECNIDMVDKNTFKLSYDYYGYNDMETWKRL